MSRSSWFSRSRPAWPARSWVSPADRPKRTSPATGALRVREGSWRWLKGASPSSSRPSPSSSSSSTSAALRVALGEIYRTLGWFGFVEMMVFLGVLMLGFLYLEEGLNGVAASSRQARRGHRLGRKYSIFSTLRHVLRDGIHVHRVLALRRDRFERGSALLAPPGGRCS